MVGLLLTLEDEATALSQNSGDPIPSDVPSRTRTDTCKILSYILACRIYVFAINVYGLIVDL